MAGSRAGEMLLRTLRAARVSHRPILLSGSTITGVTDSRNSRIPPSLYRQAVDLRVGGSLRLRDSSEAKLLRNKLSIEILCFQAHGFVAAMALEVLLLSARRVTMKKNFIQSARKTVSVVVFGCALTGIFASLGCNTVHGLGQDIERGGEKTQDAADAVKRRM